MNTSKLDEDARALDEQLSSLSSVGDHYSAVTDAINADDATSKQLRKYDKAHHGTLIAWIFIIVLMIGLFGYIISTGAFTFFSNSSSSSIGMALLGTVGCIIVAFIASLIMSLGSSKSLPQSLTKTSNKDLNFPTSTHYNFLDLIYMKMHQHFVNAPKRQSKAGKFFQGLGHCIAYVVVFLIVIAIFSIIISFITNA